MTQENPACLYCGVPHSEAPLVRLLADGQENFICAQHLPVLIHEPHKLAGKLPGAERLRGHEH
jgi:hypothetical protein